MSKEQRDILKLQTNAEETHNSQSSDQLIEREQIEGSPLWIVKIQNTYNLIMGQYKLNETPFESKKQILDYVKKEMWNIITRIIVIISNNLAKDHFLETPIITKDDNNQKPNT